MSPFHTLRGALAAIVLLPFALACASGSNDAVEKAETDRRARSKYGVALNHMEEGRIALAIRELQAAEELAPTDPWVHLSLGEAYRLKGRLDESEAHLLRSIELKPGFQPARLNLSALYVQIGKYDEAIELAQGLIDDPTFPLPWKALTNEGWALYKLGRLDEAKAKLRSAIEFHDEFWPALLDLGIIESEQGRRLEAIDYFERALKLEPGSLAEAETHYRIALEYMSLGNRAKALHHLTTATQSRPSGEWGRRSEDYLKRLR